MQKRKPIIGISCGYNDEQYVTLRATYVNAVLQAGGVPILLPQIPAAEIPAQLDLVDGVIFSGGPDYAPDLFGQTPHPSSSPMHTIRQTYDLALFAAARSAKLPLLCICAGAQLAAICFGAQLIQDIPDCVAESLPHRQDINALAHEIKIKEGTQLRAILGSEKIGVNTSHHQAVDPRNLPSALCISAVADDGIIEAYEIVPGSALDNGAFFCAVQWHPEYLITMPAHLALFQHLVKHATMCRAVHLTTAVL